MSIDYKGGKVEWDLLKNIVGAAVGAVVVFVVKK